MMTAPETGRHATSLTNGEVVEESDLGSIRRVTADNFPILSGMSIKRIVVNPGAMRTPHWHANANELTYCISGTSLVSVLDSYSRFASFTGSWPGAAVTPWCRRRPGSTIRTSSPSKRRVRRSAWRSGPRDWRAPSPGPR